MGQWKSCKLIQFHKSQLRWSAILRNFPEEFFSGGEPDAEDAVFATGGEEFSGGVGGEGEAEAFVAGEGFLVEADVGVSAGAGDGVGSA